MMKRISKFKENALQDPTELPLVPGVDPELQRQRWVKLSEDVSFKIRFSRAPSAMGADSPKYVGDKPYEWDCILDQFECEDSYLLIIEGYSIQLVKKMFGGYWVRAHSELAIIDVAKDYSESCWAAPRAYNWWWQRQHPLGEIGSEIQLPVQLQFDGVSDIQLETENSVTFRWATRGLMRLTILPERKLGIVWANYNALMLNSFRSMAQSTLRLRRVPEWGWPTSRTVWGAWRRFFELTFRHAGVARD